ncbi:hypothetical protein [uncultured Bacteroides sp.]|uniref:hypothetical protein n=1 Tax=uncultured Bacteroides sp. TaxID=162156 RepID=UPI002AABA248|nr:hypothetical protein [uncultured Bacteroides sp.]
MELYIDSMRRSIFSSVISTTVVSCYFFPFEFTFLPKGVNTKIILAVLGILFIYFYGLKKSYRVLHRNLVIATIIAIVFSLFGFIAVDYNHTNDFTYSLYIFSFITWLGGAYAVCCILRYFNGEATFRLIFHYLIIVSVLQCILALAIDFIEPFKVWIDSYISQETITDDAFLQKVDRLYGIGAALDVAGTRFSIVLLGLAALMSHGQEVRNNKSLLFFYSLAFFIICIVGNMISRTTSVGMVLALGYLLYAIQISNKGIDKRSIFLWSIVFSVVVLISSASIYLYYNDASIHNLLRYGFEGFFNWGEKGKWYTESTNRLNNTMWIWPTDMKTWLIGKGSFEYMGTDIGYCRFIFYSGLPGLIIFSIFFIYNAIANMDKLGPYKKFCIAILFLGFVIWLKVSTDLFIMYALLYCMDEKKEVGV